MKVLVDTSVWIRGLSNHEPWRRRLEHLLAGRDVRAHELIYGELLIGDKSGRTGSLADYELLPKAASVTHAEVVQLVSNGQLHGLGIGWIDAHLLAAALVDKLKLWTADPHLATLAKEFGVAYS